METSINCHFLPRVYLKNFQISGKPNFVYAAKRTKHGWSKFNQPISITKVCSIKNLFIEFKTSKKNDKDYLEKEYNKIETHLPEVCKKIIETPFFVVNKTVYKRSEIFNSLEEETLIRFLSLQIVRSPKWFHELKENFTNNFSKKERGKIKKLLKNLNRKEEEKVKNSLAHQAFLRLNEISLSKDSRRLHEKLIEQFDWVFCINLTKTPFITSDQPVIALEGGYNNFFCPLTKIYAIRIPLENRKQKQIHIETIEEDIVDKWNYTQARRAYANNYHFSTIIGDNKNLIENYIERLKKDPNIKYLPEQVL